MLEKAQEKVLELAMSSVTLKAMDATVMDFGDSEFDAAVATYTISASPDPVGIRRQMRRVVKPGGNIVVLNHFRSHRRVMGRLEDLVSPVCTRLGWKSNLLLEPLLEQVGLRAETSTKVNLFNGWRLIKCLNLNEPTPLSASADSPSDPRHPAPGRSLRPALPRTRRCHRCP